MQNVCAVFFIAFKPVLTGLSGKTNKPAGMRVGPIVRLAAHVSFAHRGRILAGTCFQQTLPLSISFAHREHILR